MYNACPQFHVRYNDNGYPNMTQFNFTRNRNLHPKLHEHLIERALNALDLYRKDVPEAKFWPEKFAFEEFRIKHYSDGRDHPSRLEIDRFDEHVDSNDLISGKRFLIFFWYLNTPVSGGKTVITNMNIHYDAIKGKLLMFPPFWMYPHAGEPVLKGDKYLLSSYLHFNS